MSTKGNTIICDFPTPPSSGLMVSASALDTGSRGLVQDLGQVIELCSCAKLCTLTVPLRTQKYRWVSADCQVSMMKSWGRGGGCGVTMDKHPIQWGVVILLVGFMKLGNQDKRNYTSTRPQLD